MTGKRSASLVVAMVNLSVFGASLALAAAGLGPREPWDLVLVAIVAIVCPFGGLFVTLSFAFREMRAGMPKRRPLLAMALSMIVFLIGLSFLAVRP